MEKFLHRKRGLFKFKKRSKSEKTIFSIVFVIFFLYAGTYVYTFGWAFLVSMREKLEFMHDPFAMPKVWHFENYVDAFKALKVGDANLFVMFFNTVWYAGGATVLGVMASNILAYAVSKYKTPFTRFYYTLTIFIMLIPIIGALPQQYVLYDNLGLIDSPAFLITYVGGTAYMLAEYSGASSAYYEKEKHEVTQTTPLIGLLKLAFHSRVFFYTHVTTCIIMLFYDIILLEFFLCKI